MAVAGGDGSVTVVDEDLKTITCFPELHKEGIISLHVVNDYITTIGYDYVYQIDPLAIQQSALGLTVKLASQE